MSLADRLVNELMLVSVLVAGDGAEALAAGLADAGAAADALQPGAAPEGFDLAILLTDPAAAARPATRALVDTLARASDRLLLAPLPLGEATGAQAALPELPLWFELFAELGYQPVVEFDASFVSPGAFLVDRAATADEGDLAAFTERLQLGSEGAKVQREAVAEAERDVRSELLGAREALGARDRALQAAQAALAQARSELTEMTRRAAEASEQNVGWEGLRAWVRQEVAYPGRNTMAALARDLPRLRALGAGPVRRRWFGGHPVLREAALVRACPLFDAAWYVAANPAAFAEGRLDPVFHYVLVGGPAGLDPGPWFDTAAYILANPSASGAPLQHAIRSGFVANANS